MKIWECDSDFDVSVGDIICAFDEIGQDWTFRVSTLSPFGLSVLEGEAFDGYKPMFQGEVTFIDNSGYRQACLFDNVKGDNIIFTIIV